MPTRRCVLPRLLPLLLVALLVPAVPAQAATDPARALEQMLVARHDDARHGAGAGSLVVTDDLQSSSRQWSDEQARRGSMGHRDLGSAICCYARAGENVGYATMRDTSAASLVSAADRLMAQWLASGGHRDNVLGGWDHFGIGIAIASTSDGPVAYATVTFRDWNGTGSPTPVAPTPMPARIGAGDAVAAAIAVVERHVPDADTVLLAREDDHADALAAAALAGRLDAPVLLIPRDGVDDRVVAAVGRLGARRLVVLGGVDAVSNAVVEDYRSRTGARTERIAGADRFATAVAVAQAAAPSGASRVYVVEGADPDPSRGWPDAVAISPVATAQAAPVLLVTTDDLPSTTRRAITALGATEVVVIGGKVAVSDAIVSALGRVEGVRSVSRWAGADRVATSAEVVRRTSSNPSTVLVVGARDHRDALAAGPAAALAGGTSLLVEPVSSPANGSALTLLSTIGARSVSVVDGAQSVSYTVSADLGIWR